MEESRTDGDIICYR